MAGPLTVKRPNALPFAAASRLLAYAYLLIGATAVMVNFGHPYQMDFVSYWAAATLALSGQPAAVYDLAAHHAAEQVVMTVDGLLPFPYPPPYLLVVMPFGLLPYGVAAATWIVTTGALYVAAMRRLFPNAGWLAAAFPPVLINVILGQNGFLTATLFAAGTVLLPRRPFIAGLVFGLLVIKPHLGVLLPLAFVAGRQWRAFAGAALGAAGALLLALLVFGSAPYAGLVEMVPLYSSIARDGLVPWHKMASVYAALSALGVPRTAAFAAHGVVATIAAAMVWRVWRSDAEPIAKAAVLAAATLLVSPYLYSYDMLLLVIPFLWLLAQGQCGALVVLLWCLPLISLLQDWGLYDRIDPLPLVSAGVLFLVWRRLAEVASERSRPAESAAT